MNNILKNKIKLVIYNHLYGKSVGHVGWVQLAKLLNNHQTRRTTMELGPEDYLLPPGVPFEDDEPVEETDGADNTLVHYDPCKGTDVPDDFDYGDD